MQRGPGSGCSLHHSEYCSLPSPATSTCSLFPPVSLPPVTRLLSPCWSQVEDPKDDKQISKALGKWCRPLYTLQGLPSRSNRDLEPKVFCSGYSSDKACSGVTEVAPRMSHDAVLIFSVSQMANWIRHTAGVLKE